MELFPQLSDFYNSIANDARIGTTHISLFMALLQQWNLNGGKKCFNIYREQIMKVAKISGRYTYNKCMNELQEFGYIRYKPSVNGYVASEIELR